MAGLIPFIDLNRCDARGVCTHVCTQDVFQIKPISKEQYEQLSIIGQLKTLFGNNRKAIVANPDPCENCGLCVRECPQQAIQLVPLGK